MKLIKTDVTWIADRLELSYSAGDIVCFVAHYLPCSDRAALAHDFAAWLQGTYAL